MIQINQRQLPGKYKVWRYQFRVYRRVMWPLKMYEISSSTTSKMDGKANSFIWNWLGLLQFLSETGLFGKNTLQLEKTRLALKL